MTDQPINPHGSEHDAPQKNPHVKDAPLPPKSTGKFATPMGSPRYPQHLNNVRKGMAKGNSRANVPQIRKPKSGDR